MSEDPIGSVTGAAWIEHFAQTLRRLWPNAQTDLLLEIARSEWRYSHAWDPEIAASAYAAVEPKDMWERIGLN